MATTKTDLFTDDLQAILRKHGISDPQDKRDVKLYYAYLNLIEEVERVLEAVEG